MLFIWVALYGIVNMLPDFLGSSQWLLSVLMVVYDVAFVFWVIRTGRRKEAELMPVCGLKSAHVPYTFLLLLPACNVIIACRIPIPDIAVWLHMLCVALTEEIYFRGFLLSRLRNLGIIRSVFLTSLIFALLHGMNFSGNEDSVYVLLQIFSSFSVSLCYCAVCLECGSIYPCVVAHFLTNITGTGFLEDVRGKAGILVCALVYAFWSWKHIRKIEVYRN